MSKIRIACPNCGNTGEVDESHRGRRALCNRCNTTFVIEAPVAELSGQEASASNSRSLECKQLCRSGYDIQKLYWRVVGGLAESEVTKKGLRSKGVARW